MHSTASKRMMTILEPMLIVLMAFVVGFTLSQSCAPNHRLVQRDRESGNA